MPVIVPPIYLHRQETNWQVERDLTEILAPEGYRVVEAVVPKKLLAVLNAGGIKKIQIR